MWENIWSDRVRDERFLQFARAQNESPLNRQKAWLDEATPQERDARYLPGVLGGARRFSAWPVAHLMAVDRAWVEILEQERDK